ncbi:type II toxin-antitoxin system prevent-host-death family antitoxin [Lapillicoccus sp.]|uniref:type II toxin-antitoxin system Phd/YefM family antitoxin n=1 Tax=Lapillicoccus sp. TaxID=1909287 RepID=UPI00344F1BA5
MGTPSRTARAYACHSKRGPQEPFPLIEQVNEDRTPVEIISRRGDAVLMSRADYDALEETAHLLRVPANARYLLESLPQAPSEQRDEQDLER